MLKHSYIVDIGGTTFKPSKFNTTGYGVDNQELFCTCGGRHKYNQKIKKDVLIINIAIFQNEDNLESIKCPHCQAIYNQENQLAILEPGVGVLKDINYYLKTHKLINGQKIIRLVRERFYAIYDEKDQNVKEQSVFDELNYNYETKKITIFINNSVFKDSFIEKILDPTNDASGSNKNLLSIFKTNISNDISFNSLIQIKQFFNFNVDIAYSNLEFCFHFLNEVGSTLIDFNKIKSEQYFISKLWENHKIILEKKEIASGKTIYKRYIYTDDEFSFGDDKVKIELQPSTYLGCIYSSAVILFSINCLNELITIFLTKKYIFFNSFISSEHIVNPNVYKLYKATNPLKIFEISTNYTRTGKLKVNKDFTAPTKELAKKAETKDLTKNAEKEEIYDVTKYLKITNLIFNKISQVNDIKYLKSFSQKNYVSKLELEQLLQKYDSSDLFQVFCFLGESDRKNEIKFKNVEHIIRHKLHIGFERDFLTYYCDTVKTISNIVSTQNKVVSYINTHPKISKTEKESLGVYLSVKESDIFEVKNSKDLKKIHDNYSILYSVFQDAAKVEAYAHSIEKHKDINDEVDFFQFEVIPSAYELQREHKVMGHCINTYIDKIIREEYLAVRVVDKISNEHSTLGLNVSKKIITFDQLKSYQNSRSSQYLIAAVNKFFNLKNIDSSQGSTWDLQADGTKSMRDSRKDVLPTDKSNDLRVKLLKDIELKQKNREEINKEYYEKKILEFQELFNKQVIINN